MSTLDNSRISPVAIKVALVVGVFVLGGIADASAQRGGGGRGGGGGGSRMASSSVAGSSRGGGNANRGNTANRGGNTANRGGNTANRSGNNVGNNNRVNNGNINTGDINRGDVNIDVNGGYGYGRARYPVAAGMAIGAMAVTTAAVVGSYYYALPSGCTSVVMNGATYSQCGSAYYQKTWQGNDVAYVVVQP